MVAAESILGGTPSLEWFEALSDTADEALAAYERFKYFKSQQQSIVPDMHDMHPGQLVRT
ncbi:MAG: hypothetical protein KGL39_37240 [Patescibacteria group bacterium]|nr:hypothetical protein [Patescibacteria group bacterium]